MEELSSTPVAMVSLMDKCTNQQMVCAFKFVVKFSLTLHRSKNTSTTTRVVFPLMLGGQLHENPNEIK